MDTWTWTFEDAEGAPTVPAGVEHSAPAEGFTAQADAETWIGERWRVLLAGGAEAAVLYEGERRVYGPMPLRPAG